MNALFNLAAKNTDFSNIARRAEIAKDNGLDGNSPLDQMIVRILENMEAITQLLVYGAYIAGIAFTVSALLQLGRVYKGGSQNDKEPLGHAIVHLAMGACLIFLPTFIAMTGATLAIE